MSWSEVFLAFFVCHMAGDFLQTDWQASGLWSRICLPKALFPVGPGLDRCRVRSRAGPGRFVALPA